MPISASVVGTADRPFGAFRPPERQAASIRHPNAARAALKSAPTERAELMTATTTHENRLARETSPYLLQHKHNPVDWWPWGPDALAEAQNNRQADPAVGRLRRLPLVPCDGAREFRGPRDRGGDERAVRQHQSRPRGAARHRPDLHGGAAPSRASRAAGRSPCSSRRAANRCGAAPISPTRPAMAAPPSPMCCARSPGCSARNRSASSRIARR